MRIEFQTGYRETVSRRIFKLSARLFPAGDGWGGLASRPDYRHANLPKNGDQSRFRIHKYLRIAEQLSCRGFIKDAARWIWFAMSYHDPYRIRFFSEDESADTLWDKRIEAHFLWAYWWMLEDLITFQGRAEADKIMTSWILDLWRDSRDSRPPYRLPSVDLFIHEYIVLLSNVEIEYVDKAMEHRLDPLKPFYPKPSRRTKTKAINLLASIGAIKYEQQPCKN